MSDEPKIVLTLPLTVAMVAILDNFAILAKDDEIPHLEGELETAETDGDRNKAAEMRAMIKAYDDFWEEVTRVIHPEVLETTQAQINNVVGFFRDAARKKRT